MNTRCHILGINLLGGSHGTTAELRIGAVSPFVSGDMVSHSIEIYITIQRSALEKYKLGDTYSVIIRKDREDRG